MTWPSDSRLPGLLADPDMAAHRDLLVRYGCYAIRHVEGVVSARDHLEYATDDEFVPFQALY